MAFSGSWNAPTTTGRIRHTGYKRRQMQAATIAFVGAPDAGKASVLHAYCDGHYPVTERAEQKRVVSIRTFHKYMVYVCDTPGDLPLVKAGGKKTTTTGPVGLVAVYSVEDRSSLEEAVNVLRGHLQGGSLLHGIALLGTWDGLRPRRRSVTYKQGRDAAHELGATFHEVACSRETTGTIQKLVNDLVVACARYWEENRQREQMHHAVCKKKRSRPNRFIKQVVETLSLGTLTIV